MSNIIPFPTCTDSFDKIKALIASVCKSAGLTPKMTEHVTAEYHEYYDQLFVKYDAHLELPAALNLTQSQSETVLKAHRESVDAISDYHTQQITHACHIIIGLLVKQQLNGVDNE